MAAFTFVEPRVIGGWGGWSRKVQVGDEVYTVSVTRAERVRIPYKPRGQNRGYRWRGLVFRSGDHPGWVWDGYVNGSIGCRGLLRLAGLIPKGG